MLLEVEETRIEPDITVLTLSGRLALGRESQRVEMRIGEMIKSGPVPLILDLRKLDYIDSAGIGLIAMAAGTLKEAGGRLALVAGEGRVLELLRLTQVASLIGVWGTVDEAAAAFGEAAAG